MTNEEQDVSTILSRYGMSRVLEVMVAIHGQLEVTKALQNATQVAHKASIDSKPYDIGS